MKHVKAAVCSGFAISLFLAAAPAFAQGSYPTNSGDRVDANGMPTTHSTPAERAQTRALNNQVSADNDAADAQAAQDQARYQAQQNQYQQEKQNYQSAMANHQMQQRDYREKREAYVDLRARYAAERAAYHRHEWPHYRHWVIIDRDIDPVGERIQLVSGDRVGTVIDTARSPSGHIDGLLVRLDGGKQVWIDNADVRYNRTDGILMTNLDRRDLREMADERL